MMFAIKMLLALFLSGAIFLFTLYRLLGFRFQLTYKKTILSILLSFCISTSVHAVHHGYMGLQQHLWFDNLGIVVLAVLLACAVAGMMSAASFWADPPLRLPGPFPAAAARCPVPLPAAPSRGSSCWTVSITTAATSADTPPGKRSRFSPQSIFKRTHFP